MIVALFKRKGGVGKSTLAPHRAGQWARQEKRISLIDADPEGCTVDWGEQGALRHRHRLLSVIGFVRHTPDRAVTGLAGHSDHIIIIAGPLRAADLPCSGLLSAASLSLTRCVTYPHANFLTPMENAREGQSQHSERGTT